MILAYPFQIGSNGESVHSEGVKCQLAMMLNTMPGTRLWYPDYGISPASLEQELLAEFAPERTLFIVQLQEKCAKYIPDMVITDVTFQQGLNEGDVVMNVYYTDASGKEDLFVWQPDSSLTYRT